MVVDIPAPLAESASLVPLAAGAAAVAAATLLWRRTAAARHDTATKSSTPLRTIHTLPDSLLLVGDLITCLRHEERFHDWLSDMCLHFRGEPWRVRIIGQQDMIVVSTPDAFESVLSSQFHEFPNGDFSNLVLSGLFGRSIMTLDGEDWHRQRKTASKFFSTKALRVCMLETMRKNVLQMYATLDSSVNSGKSVDLSKLFGQFTLQTFAEMGLGVDLRWIGQQETNPLETAIRAASPATMRRFRVPAFWWQFEKRVGFGPEQEMADATADARKWMGGIIDQSLEQLASGQADGRSSSESSETKSILELFFEHNQDDQSDLGAEDLVDFIMAFVLTAQDTSALTLARLLLLLTQYPEVEAQIRGEMARVIPTLDVSHDAYLTSDHAQHLVFLEATIRETLRLYSTVPLMQKEAGQDTTICGDIPIRKGEQICLPSYAMARNPDVWGPNAAEFKPERWIDQKTGTLITVSASKFPAFSTGPRACIGMKLALIEMRVVATNLLHQYRFSLAEPNDGDYVVGITLALKRPLIMNVTRARAA